MKGQEFCVNCHRPNPPSDKGRIYCSLRCQRQANRHAAKEREMRFLGEQVKEDERFLWTETSPTAERLQELVAVLVEYNAKRPATVREKTIEIVGSVPVGEEEDAVVPVGHGYSLVRMREWQAVTRRNIFFNKWWLERETPAGDAAAALTRALPDTMPTGHQVGVRMADALTVDEEVERQLAEMEGTAAPSATNTL